MNLKKFCVLTITLLLLTSCGGPSNGTEAEQLALSIRGDYLAMDRYAIQAKLVADYGQRVYEYTVAAAIQEEEMRMTIIDPPILAGITAYIQGEDSLLEYEGLSLQTGSFDEEGLSPVSALPVLLQALRSDYITQAVLEEGETPRLRIHCAQPEFEPGTGREITLWVDPQSRQLLQGEISVDGFRVIQCEFTQFTAG